MITWSDYKKYSKWLVETDTSVLKRKVNIYDLYNERIYNNYKNNIRENTELISEKNKTTTKRKIFKI